MEPGVAIWEGLSKTIIPKNLSVHKILFGDVTPYTGGPEGAAQARRGHGLMAKVETLKLGRRRCWYFGVMKT